MAYNKAREERKWRIWKEAEENRLPERREQNILRSNVKGMLSEKLGKYRESKDE